MASAAQRAALLSAAVIGLHGCDGAPGPHRSALGDPAHGAVVMLRQSCGACHVIPGVAEADGEVGPPLTHFAQRTMIAGMLPNTPDNLEHWLQHPQAVTPGNGMPDLGLSDRDARDVAAYLYRRP